MRPNKNNNKQETRKKATTTEHPCLSLLVISFHWMMMLLWMSVLFVCLFSVVAKIHQPYAELCDVMVCNVDYAVLIFCFVCRGRFCYSIFFILFSFFGSFSFFLLLLFVDVHYNFTAIIFPRCKLIHLAFGHTYTYVYRHRLSVCTHDAIWLSAAVAAQIV